MSLGKTGTRFFSRVETTRNVHASWFMTVLTLLLLWPLDAHAQASTLGDLICNVKLNAASFPRLINATAFIMGCFLAIRSIFLFRKHAENPNDSQITKGVAHMVGAFGLLSLPQFIGIIQRSVVGAVSGSANACSAGGVSAGGGSVGLDTMIQNFVTNIHGPAFSLLSMISMILGLTLIVRALLRGTKTATDPRAADPKAIVANLVFGAVLISMGSILPDILKTLFGVEGVSKMSSFSGVNWSSIAGSGVDTSGADNTIKAVLAFVQIIGAISFLRGWMILKTVFEGGQATIPQGITHIIGGALAINIDKALSMIDKTFGTGILNA